MIFHADPHAGNLIIMEDDRIGYVDFGITGQIDAEFRSAQVGMLQAMGEENYDQYFRCLLKLFYPLPEFIDYRALKAEVIDETRKWANSFFKSTFTPG